MSIINPIIFRIHDVIHLLNAQQINIAISEFKCTKDLNSENYLKKCTSNNRSEKIETLVIPSNKFVNVAGSFPSASNSLFSEATAALEVISPATKLESPGSLICTLENI